MRTLPLLLALVVVGGPGVAARSSHQAAGSPAQDVASALQKKYDTVRDFSADFTHMYEGGVLRKKLSEQGTVLVKKPGMMRWDYKTPEPKVFVSDGRRIYLYIPADKQVTVSPVPAGDDAATAVQFLVGQGNLTRDFTVTHAGGAEPDTYVLRLQPRLPERDYEWLQLVLDRMTLRIRSLVASDKQGGKSTFQFTNFKENVGLADKTFTFKIPRGTDVRSTGQPSR